MFAIGFLSLLSLGFVGMAMGGDDDDGIVETSQGEEFDVGYGPVDIAYTPSDDDSPEVQEQINDFVEGIEADPNRPIEDVVDELHDFLDTLEPDADAEESVDDDAPAETVEEQEFVRPPMGEEFRDPLIVAEQQAIAAAEAREPVNLVTVFGSNNSEVDDELILTENANSEATGDADFTVEPSDGPNAIAVNFDYVHSFQINYTEETASVIASLNSDIQGPEGEVVTTTATEQDSAGAMRTTVIENVQFGGSTDITLSIDFDQIGVHFSKIDLSNPADTLHLEFEGEIPGNLHMITEESDSNAPGDNSSVKTVYIIHTPEVLTAVSQSAIDAFKESDDGTILDGIIVAEIYLGEDSVQTVDGSVEEGAYEILISNFINDNPQITSSIAWTSEGAPTTDTGNTVTDNANNSNGSGFDDQPDFDFGLGTNPFIF